MTDDRWYIPGTTRLTDTEADIRDRLTATFEGIQVGFFPRNQTLNERDAAYLATVAVDVMRKVATE